MGSIYANARDMDCEKLYCEICGGYDRLIGYAETKEDAWELLEPYTNVNDSGGYDYEYIQDFLKETFGSEGT